MRTLLITALLLLSVAAQAQVPVELDGEWRWVANASQAEAIAKGVERSVASFNMFLRPIVRMQLKPVAVPFRSVQLQVADDTITFTDHLEQEVQRTVRVLGTREVAGTTEDGKPMWSTTIYEDGVLERTERTKIGGRTVRYSLAPSGVLNIGVEFFSDDLPEPLRYTLSYERPE